MSAPPIRTAPKPTTSTPTGRRAPPLQRDDAMRRVRFTRSHAIVRVRHHLETRSFPRLQMSAIVAATGAIGLLTSFVLLHAGVERMALRYPLALAVAYLGFLGLLWGWLRTRASDWADAGHIDGHDVANLATELLRARLTDAPSIASGGGGDFGGGGASATFDGPGFAAPLEGTSPLDGAAGDALKDAGEAAGSLLEADELAIPLLAIALAAGLALASFYVVWTAPALLAELLLDGALSVTLYRRLLRDGERSHWLATALRRTALPFALTALLLVGVGAALAAYAPGARSIGEALRQHDAAAAARSPR